MNFLGLFTRSALGSAVAIFLFGAVLFLLAIGVLPVLPLLVQAGITGVIFGLFYSVVHMKRQPTFLTSFGAGVGYGVVQIVIGLVTGTAAALSLGSLLGVAITGLLLGGGAFLATRLFAGK